MVVFSCNTCGEALKKNQVEKHLYRARCRYTLVSCMDCHKDFDAEQYKLHIQCITEDQKYSGEGYKQKQSTVNGERKRGEWMSLIHRVHSAARANPQSYHPGVLDLLQHLSGLPSVATKKRPFMNFLANSCRHFSKHAEIVWNMLEIERTSEEATSSSTSTTNSPEKMSELCNGKNNAEGKENGVTDEAKNLTYSEANEGLLSASNSNYDEAPNRKEKKKKAKHFQKQLEAILEGIDQVDLNEAEPEKKKKKKKKKSSSSKKVNEELVGLKVEEAQETEKKKKRKSKNKNVIVEQNGGNSEEVLETNDIGVEEEVASKKRKKRKQAPATENQEDEVSPINGVKEEVASKKRKKRKQAPATEDQEDEVSPINGMEGEFASKKRKKHKQAPATENQEDEVSPINGMEEEVASKKRKNRKQAPATEDQEDEVSPINGMEGELASKKRKKRKQAPATEDQVSHKKVCLNDTLDDSEVQIGGKFKWKSTIVKVLKSSKRNRLPVKKLRRMVLAAYNKNGGDQGDKNLSANKISAKFDKMLLKVQNVVVEHQSVRLVT